MPERLVLVAAIACFLFSPARLSAQEKYVGLTLCSPELESPHPDFSVGLDRTRNAYVTYRELPKARLVMIVVYEEENYKCGTIRDAREFRFSRDAFAEECIEALHPENVVVGFFDQKFNPEHPERGARFRGPAVQSWRIDLKNLKFAPTFGNVTCVVRDLAGNDDGSDLAIWAHQRAIKSGQFASEPSTSDTQGAPVVQVTIEGALRKAMPIERVLPRYPEEGLKGRMTGTVELHVVFERSGTVRLAEVVSGNPLFAQAALDAVRHWKYPPTMLDGKPVEVDTLVFVTFALSGR